MEQTGCVEWLFGKKGFFLVFSPYWNVPASIVENEILPAVRRNRRYLSANGYERTGTENGLPKICQKPGKNNSLSLVKFLFPNEHDIYFHDSPEKTLFTHRVRAYSHGCVRLAEPAKLAAYLLQNNPEWTPFENGGSNGCRQRRMGEVAGCCSCFHHLSHSLG
ncbi:MAG TPA: L,D-transpeptidase family protein [Flavisolibacter sp.]